MSFKREIIIPFYFLIMQKIIYNWIIFCFDGIESEEGRWLFSRVKGNKMFMKFQTEIIIPFHFIIMGLFAG